MKSERLQSIINAIKLKAEHLEAVTELTTCKEDLVNYRKKSDGLEGKCVGKLSLNHDIIGIQVDRIFRTMLMPQRESIVGSVGWVCSNALFTVMLISLTGDPLVVGMSFNPGRCSLNYPRSYR